MGPRYARPEMTAIWSAENRFRIWFEIEAHATDALADLGVVPGSKLAVMRDGNKIAELDVNAVESRVSTATILPSTVTAGERVEAGDVVVSVRP